MDINKQREIEIDVLKSLMRPFVRFCVRRSYPIQDFLQIAKTVFVKVAEEEIRKASPKINVSRISVMTGIYRDEVTRIFKEKVEPTAEPLSVFTRVVGQWRQDKRFITKGGTPKVLGIGGDSSEFQQLVETVSKNINPGTVLFELKRKGLIEETRNGVRLLHQMFSFGEDPRTGFELLSQDVEALLDAVEENLVTKPDISNLHIRTEYDNISVKEIPTIKQWLVDEGKAFHKKARQFLAQFDKDVNPELEKEIGGGKVVLGAFGMANVPPKKPEVGKESEVELD